MTRAHSYRTLLLLLIIWAFATYWNLDKAFHVDDAGHLEIARWIALNPLHPMSGLVNWNGIYEPISNLNQPHLYFYLMAGWAKIFGYSEISLHCLMAAFSLWAVMAFYRLSRLFEPSQAICATTLFGLSCAFVVGQNSMVDVPLLALWLEFYCTLLTPTLDDKRKYLFATLLCAAALLVKYTSLVLLPALALHILITKKYRNLYWLMIPVIALLLWSAFNFYDYGAVHILDRATSVKSLWSYLRNALAWVVTLGAIMPFAVWAFATKIKFSERRARSLAWAILCLLSLLAPAAIALSLFVALPILPLNLTLYVSFFVSGAGAIVLAYSNIKPALLGIDFDSKKALLAYWFLSSFLFTVLLAPFMATRHVLLAMPAVLLMMYPYATKTEKISKTYLFALALTVSNSVLLAKADHWYAGVYQNTASTIIEDIPPTSEIWFLGQWGWQWYAQQAGMHKLSPNGRQPSAGDFLVIPLNVYGGETPPRLDLQELRTITVARDQWYQHYAGINFYLSPGLPFAYSAEPIEIFKVFQIRGPK